MIISRVEGENPKKKKKQKKNKKKKIAAKLGSPLCAMVDRSLV
jgi:hypothetical protein